MATSYTIADLKSGCRQAFELIFHTNYERVYLYVRKKTGSSYLAEEATQLAFIKLWQYRESLREDLPLLVQLFRITRTTLIDLLRKQKISSLPERSIPGASSTNDTWEKIMVRELDTHLRLTIRNMPPVRKKVFELSRSKGMSNKEIASSLSISVKAVEFHITQAIRYLKRSLPGLIFYFLT